CSVFCVLIGCSPCPLSSVLQGHGIIMCNTQVHVIKSSPEEVKGDVTCVCPCVTKESILSLFYISCKVFCRHHVLKKNI
uniref:Uncharacterized protein n=1 Tax=Oryzias sinensis TaxID=183150 RepID=A0A8C7YXP3_9TELE